MLDCVPVLHTAHLNCPSPLLWKSFIIQKRSKTMASDVETLSSNANVGPNKTQGKLDSFQGVAFCFTRIAQFCVFFSFDISISISVGETCHCSQA